MATLTFDRKEFEKYIKINEEVAEKIRLFGVPIEIEEKIISIEILPQRPDMLSLQGFVRAISYFIGKEKFLREYKVKKPEKEYKVVIDSSVKEVRPYTVCAIIKGLKFSDSIIKEVMDVQEKLHSTLGRNRKKIAIGIYPLEKISLPIKYEARKPEDIKFMALESKQEMFASDILEYHPIGRSYRHLLDSCKVYPVFVDSKKKILSMPPIINSDDVGKITSETKEVFIECSGSHFGTLGKTLSILTSMFADMGGKIYAMELDYGKGGKFITPNLKPEKIRVSAEDANFVLGLQLKEEDLQKLLLRMGYKYKKGTAEVPAWRADVMHSIDVIEDIAIAYGYENLEPEIPKIFTVGEEKEEHKISEKIANLFIGLGFLETSLYHFIKESELGLFDEEKISLASSKTDYKFLRSNLLIPSLRIFSENKDNDYPQKIFEIGSVFLRDKSDKSETGILEEKHLIIASSPGNFTDIKRILDYFGKMLALELKIKEIKKRGFIEGRTALITLNNKPIGYFGELHPDALRNAGMKIPASVLEISLEEIFNVKKK